MTGAAAMHRLTVATPLGLLRLSADAGAVTALDWVDGAGEAAGAETGSPLLDEAARQLRAYFAGRLTRFDLPLAPAGTPFQHRAWAAMAEIPYGATTSYGELARRLGSAARAVGGACRTNPLPILVPCHRVLAGGGRPGGYSGGNGLETKAWLLRHEGAAPR